MKKFYLLIFSLFVGVVLTLISTAVKTVDVKQGQFCWPDPNNCQPYTNRTTMSGFPLKHEESTHSSIALTKPIFYKYKFGINVLFWTIIAATTLWYVANVRNNIASSNDKRQKQLI